MKFILRLNLIPLVFGCISHGLEYLNMANVDCGTSQSAQKSRIINGTEAKEGEFPWTVSLTYRGTHLCGGTLISSEWILSAAHCFRGKFVMDVLVTVGEVDLKGNSIVESNHKIGIVKLILHPEFTKAPFHDIALLKLNSSVTWGPRARPACLATSRDEKLDGMVAEVAGWGFMDELSNGGKPAKALRKVEVPLLDNEACQGLFDEARNQRKIQNSVSIQESVLCAGYETGGKDACQGDSGSSLQVSENTRKVVVGIVSTGVGCARPLLPGLYTRVAHYVDWITSIIRE